MNENKIGEVRIDARSFRVGEPQLMLHVSSGSTKTNEQRRVDGVVLSGLPVQQTGVVSMIHRIYVYCARGNE